MKIEKIKENKNNPRTISKDKFEKLKKSIQEFPQMLTIRPLVIDETFTVLGGNMRLKALKELGYTDVPVIQKKDLTDAQKKEFVLKDNASFGEWDYEILTNEWGYLPLDEWGIDISERSLAETFNPHNGKFDAKEMDYPITIIVNAEDFRNWERLKKEHEKDSDTKLFFRLTELKKMRKK